MRHQPLPANAGYARIHPLLLPDHWPPSADVDAALQRFRDEAGARGWQAAPGVALAAGNAGLFALLLLRRRRAVAQNRAGRRQAGP